MTELVLIYYAGKEYIGTVKEISAQLERIDTVGGREFMVNGYCVTLIEKDTFVSMSEVFVNSLFDIKPYHPHERRDYAERIHTYKGVLLGDLSNKRIEQLMKSIEASFELDPASGPGRGTLKTKMPIEELRQMRFFRVVEELPEVPT